MLTFVGAGQLFSCCCCCPPGGRAAARLVGTSGVTIPPFTPEESETLERAARRFFRDTGRQCQDFFPTLRDTTNADHYLAGRETLLTKAKQLTQEELTSASETLCTILPPPGPGLEPRPERRRPPPPPPEPCPFTVRSRFGPQVIRSPQGLGCHSDLASAIRGRKVFLRNNPGITARIESDGQTVPGFGE